MGFESVRLPTARQYNVLRVPLSAGRGDVIQPQTLTQVVKQLSRLHLHTSKFPRSKYQPFETHSGIAPCYTRRTDSVTAICRESLAGERICRLRHRLLLVFRSVLLMVAAHLLILPSPAVGADVRPGSMRLGSDGFGGRKSTEHPLKRALSALCLLAYDCFSWS